MKKIFAFVLILNLFTTNVVSANTSLTDISGLEFEEEITMLFDEGVVHGHPDGTFRSEETLTRAGFVKIVLEASYPEVNFEEFAGDCFSDVTTDNWFSGYVCFAKENGIVAGFDDGEFKAGNSVHQGEAIRILVESFDTEFDFDTKEGQHWYDPYFDYMEQNGYQYFEHPVVKVHCFYINRGEMAKLTSQFLKK